MFLTSQLALAPQVPAHGSTQLPLRHAKWPAHSVWSKHSDRRQKLNGLPLKPVGQLHTGRPPNASWQFAFTPHGFREQPWPFSTQTMVCNLLSFLCANKFSVNGKCANSTDNNCAKTHKHTIDFSLRHVNVWILIFLNECVWLCLEFLRWILSVRVKMMSVRIFSILFSWINW